MMQRFLLAVFIPILSLAVVGGLAVSLGLTFLYLHHAMHGELGVIILGLALVILVPVGAFLAQNAVEKADS